MNKKKIFIIAPDFYGIDKAICRAFEDLGFEVILKNTRKRLSLTEKVLLRSVKFPLFSNLSNEILKLYLEKDNKDYIASLKRAKPDILFIIKGETIFPETLKIIKNALKILCLAYIWDCPFYSFAGRSADMHRKNNFSKGMYLYDYIFVYDPIFVEEIRKRGVANVSYQPLATDSDQYKSKELSEQESKDFKFDICFVGSPFANRIEILDKLADFNLGVFGDGWKRYYRFKKIPSYYKGKAAGDKVAKIYSSSKIVLNIHDPEVKSSTNTRTFDILSCGAFAMVDYKPELERLFEVGKEIVCYSDLADLRKKIRFYLENEELRRKIAEKGRAKVISSHTWHHRVKDMLRILNEKEILT